MMSLMERGVGARSVNRKLSALQRLFPVRFESVGDITVEPTALIDPPKTPKRLPEFVEEKSMHKLLDSLEWPEKGRKGLTINSLWNCSIIRACDWRNCLAFGWAMWTCLKALYASWVKGRRNASYRSGLIWWLRWRRMWSVAVADKEHPARRHRCLWMPRGSRSLAEPYNGSSTHYLSGVTSQDKRSPHVLRHTFATHMLEHGADLNAVKELLGHANLAATQVYTHNTVEKLRKVHAKAHPRGGRMNIELNN